MRLVAALFLVLLIAACSRSAQGPAGGSPPADSSQVRGRFSDTGSLGSFERPSADARMVRGLGFERERDHERFVVLLGDSLGAPARSPGAVQAELIRPLGIVRLRLDRRVGSTAISDSAFRSALAARAFVVRSLDDRRLFVDLHLKAPALARADVFTRPGRVVVELEPGGSPLPPPAPASPRTVVLTPRGGLQGYPILIWGYARNFEANVVAELRKGGRMARRQVTTSADWMETWGEFRLRFADGPRDSVELFVGDYSAKDGSEDGVKIGLQVR